MDEKDLNNSENSSKPNFNLPQELIALLEKVAEKLGLDNDKKLLLFTEFNLFASTFKNEDSFEEVLQEDENNHSNNDENNNDEKEAEELKEKLVNAWGDNLKANKMYLHRSLKWLDVNSPWEIPQIDMFKLVNKMVDLGKLLMEDNNLLLSLEDGQVSRESAIAMRKKLMCDKSFFKIITNKHHADYNNAKTKLDSLNKIIASNHVEE